jgi:hypothetical protein
MARRTLTISETFLVLIENVPRLVADGELSILRGDVINPHFASSGSSRHQTTPRFVMLVEAKLKWLPRKDSNLDKEIQNLLCYHYTTRQFPIRALKYARFKTSGKLI